MKILILSSKMPYPPRDGGAIATLNLAIGLAGASRESEVTLLTLNTKKHHFPAEHLPSSLLQKIHFIAVDIDTTLHLGLAFINLLFSRLPYITERFRSERFSQVLTGLLREEHFDIIQLEGSHMGLYIPLIRRQSKAPITLRAHNVEHEIWSRKASHTRNPLHRIYLFHMSKRLERFENKVCGRVDLVISISDRDRSVLDRLSGGKPSLTIPAGIDPDEYPVSAPLPGSSLFFIGSLDWMPNQEGLRWFLKRVLPILVEKEERVAIHIAGRNAQEELLNELKHPSLIYHGEVEDARAFMQRYGIMVAPLFSGSGIRVKIIEAMALGKCVVTTPIGAEGLNAKDGRDLFLASEEKGFTEKVLRLMNQPELRAEVSASARNFISRNFDTFAVAGKLHEFYKKQA